MRVWFAIRGGYESDAVFGPFAERAMACDFIEKEGWDNERFEWWEDDWYVAEAEIAEKWEDWGRLSQYSGKKYRPTYCKKMRREKHEQWRKENPERAKLEDEHWKIMREALASPPSPIDILDNLQFGQEIQVKIPKNIEDNES